MGTKMDSELQKKLTTELEKFQALQKGKICFSLKIIISVCLFSKLIGTD